VFAEYQGKAWLAAAGLAVPEGALAASADEASAIAARIGYPVVIKAQASELPHKSDVGGVIVGLADEAALRAGWDRLQKNIATHRPGLVLDGVLVEAMGPRGLELVVGARRDAGWGPVVLVGLGGVWIEALKDVRLIPADLAEADVVQELGRLKAASLLRGIRGAEAVDVAAIARAVKLIGEQMRANPAITEIDVNPLVAYPDRVLALDALVVCTPQA
jgi:succinyl-CoA synthetase beta subunit